MDPLDYNASLDFTDMELFFVVGSSFQHFLVCQLCLMFLVISFLELVDHLAFLQASMAQSRQNRIPVPETIFFHNCFLIFGLQDIAQGNSFYFCILDQHILTLQDIVLF